MIRGLALISLLLAVVCGQNSTNTTMAPPPGTTMAPPPGTTMMPPPQPIPFWYATYNISFFPSPPALSSGYCQPLPDIPFAGTPKHVKQTCMNGMSFWAFYNDAGCAQPALDQNTNMPITLNSTQLQMGFTQTLAANDPRRKVFPNLPGSFKFWSCDMGGSNPAIALHTAPAGNPPNCALSSPNLNAQVYYGSPACLTNGVVAYRAEFNCAANQASVWTVDPMNCTTHVGTMPSLLVDSTCMNGPPNSTFSALAMKFDATCADFPGCGVVGSNTCTGGTTAAPGNGTTTTTAPSGPGSSGNMLQIVSAVITSVAAAAIFAF